jgi:MoxR-like ATPase
MQDAARRVHSSEPLRSFVVALMNRTRQDPRVELGASPRAGLMLLRAAKARALLLGRDHALPDDVQALATVVLSHRIVLAADALDVDGRQIVADALAATPAL